ncbi:filamentous hemagglutinin family protein [Oxalobacteraceae bacterium GrIS 1.11]
MKTKPSIALRHGAASASSPLAASHLRRKWLALLIASCFGSAAANPVAPQVVNGQVTFNRQGNVFSITNTPNAIINWQSFSIGADELTRFIQQGASSSVLNRITGQDPSRILGALQSNGRVFLINPNGILFGQGARVDVNGLVASSLAISNADFLSGKNNFTGGATAGPVNNQGSIATAVGGQVFLIAPDVANAGIISAPNGQVVLAAGHSVQLADASYPGMQVLVSAPADQAVNLGQIIARSGQIGMVGALLYQRGKLNADSAVRGENGMIVLKSSGTTLLEAGSVTQAIGAGGANGGQVQLLGPRVGLSGDALVDVSGAAGGGSILLGGDYQGKNAALTNAGQSYLGPQARLNADALSSGKGGKVIVWSDGATRVFGTISARGGARGGDGGFVETSGHYLDMQATVDTRAPHGKTGSLLLDPTNLYIASDVSTAQGAGMSGANVTLESGGVFAETGPVNDSMLSTGSLVSALNSANVTVTTANPNGAGAGFIKLVSPLAWTSASSLSLEAAAGISLQAALTAPSAALSAHTTTGDITQTAAFSVASLSAHADAGNIALNDGGNLISGGVMLQAGLAASIAAATLNITSSSSGGAMTGYASAGNLTLNGNITTAGGAVSLSAASGGAINTAGGVQVASSGGAVFFQADKMDLAGQIVAGAGAVTLTPMSDGVNVALGAGALDGAGTLGLSEAELRRITSSSLLAIGDYSGSRGGDVNLIGDLDLYGTLNANLLIDTRVGSIVIGSGTHLTVANILNLQTVPSGNNRITNMGTITAAGVNLFSGKMTLAGGSIVAPWVSLSSQNSIDIGSVNDLSNTLVLSAADLASLSTGNLDIGVNSANPSGAINISAPLTLAGGLSLSAQGVISAPAAVSVGGTFTLAGGSWVQNSGAPPAFFAQDFRLTGGSFLRIAGGTGSSGNPYQITDVYGLQGAATLALSNHYLLNNDIDASGTTAWNSGAGFVPIAFGDTSGFSGALDGASKSVSGLVIRRPGSNSVGLFSVINGGMVQDLNLVGGGVVGATAVGALAGAISSGSAHNVSSTASVGGKLNAGGLVGSNGGMIDHSASAGAVSGTGTSPGDVNIGGLVGFNLGTISLSAASGAVTTGSSGGVVGGLVGSNTNLISNSAASGPVSGAAQKMGGLAGENVGGTISGAYATGSVNGARDVGGLVGYNSGYLDNVYASGAVTATVNGALVAENVGGLVGENASGAGIMEAYSRGLVGAVGFSAVGGAVGSNGGSLGSVYWNTETSGQASDGGGAVGLSSAQMQQQASFSGFDFSSSRIWRIYDGHTDPLLTAFLTPLLVTVSSAPSKVYDGLAAAFGGSLAYTGLSNGDLGANGVPGYTAALNVGNYAFGGLWSTKYDISYAGSTNLNVSARPLTITVGGSRAYDGTLTLAAPLYTINNLVNGDTIGVGGSATFLDKNAGLGKALHVSGVALTGNGLGNYSFAGASLDGFADINKALLSITGLTASSRVYDGGMVASASGGLTGVIGSEDVSLVAGSATFADKLVGTGKAVNVASVGLAGLDAGNYQLGVSSASTTGDITARTLHVTYGGVNKVYDGGAGATVTMGDDRVTGDALGIGASASFADKNVGPAKAVSVSAASLSGTDAGNYVLASSGGATTADITARTLHVTYGGVNKVYDGGAGATVTMGDDRVTGDALGIGASASFADKNAGAAKAVSVSAASLSGTDAGNYVLASSGGATVADITARTLHVTYGGVNKVYDGGMGATVTMGDDRVAGDALGIGASASFADKNAGAAKAVSVSGASLSGLDAGNYVLASSGGATVADITARTLHVTYGGVNKVYDGGLGASVTMGDDRVTGDALGIVASASFADKNVGSAKAVSVSGASLSGLDAGNYALASSGGAVVANITPRTLHVNYVGVNKVYDGGVAASIAMGDDRITGDALNIVASASFADKNAGAGKVVNVGAVGLSGADAGNYVTAGGASATADIAARTLHVSYGGIDKVYDGDAKAAVTSVDDRLTGDVVFIGRSASFADKNVGTGKIVSVSDATLQGPDAGNYALASTGGGATAALTPRLLHVSYSGGNKVYDSTVVASFTSSDDRIGGDQLNLGASATFADKNVGAGKVITLGPVTLNGADAGNYRLAPPGIQTGTSPPTGTEGGNPPLFTLSGSISPATLAMNGYTVASRAYDGSVNASVSAGALIGVLGADAVGASATGASFADKNVGNAKIVSFAGFRLSGPDAGNYVLPPVAGSASASITAKLQSTWVASGGGLWSDAANWDAGVVPDGANVLAVVLGGGNGVVTYSAAAANTSIRQLSGAQGLSLTGGSLTVGADAADRSTLTGAAGLNVSGGSLQVHGGLTLDTYAQSGGQVGGSGSLNVNRSFSQSAGALGIDGALAIVQASGDLSFANLSATSISLSAAAGRITQSGPLRSASLTTRSQNGTVLTDGGNRVGGFSASNSAGGGIAFTNATAPATLQLGALETAAGDIAIDNTGGIETQAVNAHGGNVSITAHSPITVDGTISGADINLGASTDILFASLASLNAQHNIGLKAGGAIALDGAASLAAGNSIGFAAGTGVTLGGNASLTGGSISLHTLLGNIDAGAGVSINSHGGPIDLSAPQGAVNAPQSIFVGGSVPVIVDGTGGLSGATSTASSAPVTQALASTINIINSSAGAGDLLLAVTDVARTGAADKGVAKKDEPKDDAKDESKAKDAAASKDTGVKKDEPVKKMYCN